MFGMNLSKKGLPFQDKIFEEFGLRIFINGLPKSLDTPITSQIYSNGVELSGGQFQKLRIAKFFKNNKSLKLIDEPTNNLDSSSKSLFYDKILNDNEDNITLLISHNFVEFSKFNKIFILEEGYLIGQGSHDYLVKDNSKYKEMYTNSTETSSC